MSHTITAKNDKSQILANLQVINEMEIVTDMEK
jgi:hypothetical protein